MPSRILYAGQECKIVTAGGLTRYLPVQSASCEVTRPIEDILSFGHLGSLGRLQNEASNVKCDIKSYIPNTTGSSNSLLNSAFIQGLTGEAVNGLNSVITVTPNGFTMSGILTSIGIDLTNGSFGTADLSFVGLGDPVFASVPTGAITAEQANMPTSFLPVISANVGGNVTGAGCANSFKFSLDIPTESISCLGGASSGTQGAIASSYLQVGKPPFKTSISLEGYAVDPTSITPSSAFNVGKLAITLPAAQIVSRSYNNAVGQAGASYNFVLEDVTFTCSDTA
jgi:hypothetical protein